MRQPALLPDAWFSRDLPVLVEAVRHFDTSTQALTASSIAERMGWDVETVRASVRALARGGYVVEQRASMSSLPGGSIKQVSAEAYREAGAWPTAEAVADRLLAALQKAVDQAPEGEAKGKARRALDAFLAAGRDFAVDVASGVATGAISGS
ncbi:DNA-binding GntR family transcriptional regulator [Geodermatophilus bullaregiensis]|uniref:hypothetical protein n=1 Tax=Geodermatophilus bullaregiensis TaxID=1564160 RepID=UPI00195A8860|nr:hypothetical protein [Geodermatophilus bullaregiensis]MBM7804967.1 DNA-binding GntR family transcriptional regulator [Geodermatophilus bullaregiensis]